MEPHFSKTAVALAHSRSTGVHQEARVFLGNRISIFCGFSDLPRAPAPSCDHGLLRQRVNVRTTTTTTTTTNKLISALPNSGSMKTFGAEAEKTKVFVKKTVADVIPVSTSTSSLSGLLAISVFFCGQCNTGDPGTRFPTTQLPTGSENPRVLSSDPTRQMGRTRPGIPTGYPGYRNQGPTSSPTSQQYEYSFAVQVRVRTRIRYCANKLKQEDGQSIPFRLSRREREGNAYTSNSQLSYIRSTYSPQPQPPSMPRSSSP